jgi:hypothetical protein
LVVVSSKEERKKSVWDSSVNGYLGLWLTCPLAAVSLLLLEASFMQI